MAKANFADIQEHAKGMIEAQTTRRTMFNDLEDMFLLTDGSLPSDDHIKETISPDARNELLGAVRLMTATEPGYNVPADKNNTNAQGVATKLENAAAAIHRAASRISGKPLHYDLVLTALLYGEMHFSVKTTKDILQAADKVNKARWEDINKRTPLLFEVISPQVGYPEFDSVGLSAYTAQRMMPVRDVISRRGAKAEKQLAGKRPSDEVEYNEYWDSQYHAVWIGGEKEPIMLEEHKLPFIPIVCTLVEGGELFTRTGQQTRQPFLYSLWKSGLWKRANLSLTVIYSMMYAFAANPMFVLHQATEGDEITLDFDTPGGVAKIPPGAKLEPLNRQVVDPVMLEGLKIADEKTSQSTIYRQTLGEPLGGNAPFSMVSLLSTAGRQPLIPYQRAAGWVLGEAMRIGFAMLREQGGKVSIMGKEGAQEFDTHDIPDVIEINANLEIDTPQDDRQNAMIAMQLTGGDNPMLSKDTAAQRFLKLNQYDEEQYKIWRQQFAQSQAMIRLQQMIQQAQVMAQQQAMGGQPGAPQGPGAMQTGAAEGLPGVPLASPLPPGGYQNGA